MVIRSRALLSERDPSCLMPSGGHAVKGVIMGREWCLALDLLESWRGLFDRAWRP